MTNGYDSRVLITTIKRIVDPDRYYSKNQPEYTIFPPSKYDQERFIHSIEANPEWKRSFLTLHQMMKWLKGIIFLVSYYLLVLSILMAFLEGFIGKVIFIVDSIFFWGFQSLF